jgi:hypothetical protein
VLVEVMVSRSRASPRWARAETSERLRQHRDVAGRALFVHSPLVGPATLLPLARVLDTHWGVHAPDLRNALSSTEDFARAPASAGRCNLLIGHSGAGALLPVIATHVQPDVVVFVDAVVPPEGDTYTPSATFLELLDTIPTAGGLLAPWHEWWPPGTIERLVPDPRQRATIVDEIPRVPRAFYEQSFALPPNWWTGPMAYLQLSGAYDEDRARAEAWGWPTAGIEGHHLDVVTRPALVAEAVGQLVTRITGWTGEYGSPDQ